MGWFAHRCDGCDAALRALTDANGRLGAELERLHAALARTQEALLAATNRPAHAAVYKPPQPPPAPRPADHAGPRSLDEMAGYEYQPSMTYHDAMRKLVTDRPSAAEVEASFSAPAE